MKKQGGEQRSVFEVDARAAAMRACVEGIALLTTMEATVFHLRAAKLTDIERQLLKTIEFQRLALRRLATALEQLEKRAVP